jgi:hypothetical protein
MASDCFPSMYGFWLFSLDVWLKQSEAIHRRKTIRSHTSRENNQKPYIEGKQSEAIHRGKTIRSHTSRENNQKPYIEGKQSEAASDCFPSMYGFWLFFLDVWLLIVFPRCMASDCFPSMYGWGKTIKSHTSRENNQKPYIEGKQSEAIHRGKTIRSHTSRENNQKPYMYGFWLFSLDVWLPIVFPLCMASDCFPSMYGFWLFSLDVWLLIVFSSHASRENNTVTMAKGKRTKEQARIYKTLHRKLKIEQHESHYKPRVNSGALEELGVSIPLVAPIV